MLFVNMTQLTLSVELINSICVKLARLAGFSIIITNIEFSRFFKIIFHFYNNFFLA